MRKQSAPGRIIPVILTILVGGCTPRAVETALPVATEGIQVEAVQSGAEVEESAMPTGTVQPTFTPLPTATRTPRPTHTPTVTATSKPTTSPPQATKPPTQLPVSATATITVPAAATATPMQESAGEVVPPGTSVWVLDTAPSETGTSEKCPAPFFADFYGLVRIETIDNGITWMRAQDGITYTLLRQSPNVYWGTGASIYPGYTLTISVVFASPTGLGATFVLIDQAIEGCNHYWKYGGTLR